MRAFSLLHAFQLLTVRLERVHMRLRGILNFGGTHSLRICYRGNARHMGVSMDDDYIISIDKISKSSNDFTSYKAFISVVNNERLLNVWEKEASTPAYYFYKIVRGDTESILTLVPV